MPSVDRPMYESALRRVSRGNALFFAIVTSVGAVLALSASIAGKSASRPARPSILPASDNR
jgi:hypothetical protein